MGCKPSRIEYTEGGKADVFKPQLKDMLRSSYGYDKNDEVQFTGNLIVAVRDNKAIGFVEVKNFTSPLSRTKWTRIVNAVVVPEERGKGILRRLVSLIQTENRLIITVDRKWKYAETNRDIWEKLGFTLEPILTDPDHWIGTR